MIAGQITNALLMTSLANERDQCRKDFVALAEQAAEQAVLLAAAEKHRDAARASHRWEMEARAACLARIAVLERVLLAARRVMGDVHPAKTGHVVVSADVIDALAAAVVAAADAAPTPGPQSSAGEATP